MIDPKIRTETIRLRVEENIPTTRIAKQLHLAERTVRTWLINFPLKETQIVCTCGKTLTTIIETGTFYCSDNCRRLEYLRRDRLKWKNDPDRRKTKSNRNRLLKHEVFSHYCCGIPKCQCPSGLCHETLLEFLTLDHINNNGAEDRGEINGKRCGGGNPTYLRLKREKYPSGFRVLCYNCNCGRAKTAGNICPHEIK